jgi:phenylacetate-CoA ligase
MLKVTTSGSTGEPFTTYADRHQLEWRFATTMRAAEWTGWRFGDRQARLWHQTLGMSWSQVVRERIDALFMRRMFIPAYEIKDSNIRDLMRKLVKHRPVLVDGYAESFNFLAHYAHTHGMEGFQPKAVMSSAQIMPEQVRETIETSFQTRVYDKYGSREFSGIAYEDEGHDGHLVMAESYIVEILKDGRPALPGEIGEVVITDLNNFHVPIIRYRIGDLAVAVDENCGLDAERQFPRLGRIEGRSQAIVMCSNGAWLPGTFFAHFFKDHDQIIRHYQVVQEEREAITIKIVPGMHFTEEALAAIIGDLRHFTGDDMRIETQVVDAIPLVRTGKRTSVVSKLNLDFQEISAELQQKKVA